MISEKEKQRRLKISKTLMGHSVSENVRKAFSKAGKERIREKNPAWRGGIQIIKRPRCFTSIRKIYLGKRKYKLEHILVMEKHLGRKLKRNGRKGEVVHHLNGNGLDNRIENLKLFSSNNEHVKEEQKLNLFAKKILYGGLLPKLQKTLLEEYKKFNVK